jgi:hypothetical protein
VGGLGEEGSVLCCTWNLLDRAYRQPYSEQSAFLSLN